MKRLYIFFVVLLVITVGSFAQDTSRSSKHIGFGIKAGVNFANVLSRKESTTKSKGGDILIAPAAGFFMTVPTGKGFSFQPEVIYNGMGWKYIPYNAATTKYTFNYVSVPLLVRYNLEHAGIAMFLGPQANFLLSAKASSDSLFKKDNYKSFDVSGVAGLEYLFNNGFSFSVRYQYGLINLLKNPPTDGYFKLHGLNVSVGYLLKK